MNLRTMKQRTEGMKRQATELIEQSYQRGYKAGYEASCNESKDLFIEQGRNETWAAVKKIFLHVNDGGLSSDELEKIFGELLCIDVVQNHSASEVVEKLRAYEEQKKQGENNEIHVGDEVRFHNRTDTSMFVIKIGKSGFIDGMDAEGNMYINQSPENWIKTGRTLPEVAELLNNMGKVEEHAT